MFRVTSNREKNRLYITLAGHLEGLERQSAIQAMKVEIDKLAPGFDLVTDISGLHPSDQEGFKDFLRAKATLKLKGVGHIFRVVKIPLSRIQVDRISEGAGYLAENVPSVEAADQRLDGLRRR